MARPRKDVPWIEKRRDTYYVFWYEEAQGASPRLKRISLRTTDSVEAKKCYAAFLANEEAIFGPPGQPAKISVKAVLRSYEREHVMTDKVVDKIRALDAIANLVSYFGNTPISEVDIPASRGYAEARRLGACGGGRKLRRRAPEGSDPTIRRELVVLKAAAGHALRWRRITVAEMPSIELPQEAACKEIWLTQAELALAFSHATGRLKDFMVVAYYTGARRASIEALTKFQVDLAQGRINLSSPHESSAQRRSKKRRPVVPIDAKLRPTLERLMAESPNEWVFGDCQDQYRAFNEHMTAIGLEDKAFPHILRHSRATHLLQSGVNIYDVAKLLGDTVATVERVYGHHSADYLATAIAGEG